MISADLGQTLEKFVAGLVAEQPGELDHARPVVEIAQRRLPVAGQARRLGVEKEEPHVGGAVEIQYHVHGLGVYGRRGRGAVACFGRRAR